MRMLRKYKGEVYSDLGRKRILKSAMMAMFAADKDPGVMAMWHTDFKDYIIHQIK